jgi:hypothetical protein
MPLSARHVHLHKISLQETYQWTGTLLPAVPPRYDIIGFRGTCVRHVTYYAYPMKPLVKCILVY